MNTAYDAVVELWGTTCRVAVGSRAPVQWYAHTEQTLNAHASRALFAPAPLPDAQAAALTDVQAQLTATFRTATVAVDTLHVLVHPPAALTVQAPLQSTASASACRRALMQQAALLTGARRAQALQLSMTTIDAPLPAPASMQWYRGLVLPHAAHARASEWAEAINADHIAIANSAARTCDASASRQHGWHLGVGCHSSHTEYALWHSDSCAYLYYTPLASTPTDRAYFAALLLNRLRLSESGIAAVWTYGPAAQHAAMMPPIAGVQPRLAQLPHSKTMHRLHASDASGSLHPLRWAAVHSVLASPTS
ncbi:hypothetical protein CRI93_04100 [Longimonas halophila]|uniref:Uncharacterized protein n=1 Tax=Longimonas halophila TaxID=1469170 RepID=A0A2H3NN41_9BACT|nr:hypothetical protein [Longimonas halophila]PEN08306.1 hypothetical protein CRI93_04100 [Longimonas halophila]